MEVWLLRYPDSVLARAPRVARARGVSVDQVNRLAAQFTEGPELGVLGEPRVNVLKLNSDCIISSHGGRPSMHC